MRLQKYKIHQIKITPFKTIKYEHAYPRQNY
jgi:hypothetical protein